MKPLAEELRTGEFDIFLFRRLEGVLQKMEASWKLRGAKAIYAQMWSSQSWWMLGPRWPPRMGILRIPLGVTLVFGASLREASFIEGFSPGQVLEPSEWEVHVLAVSL